ncbi:hypothetical protein [Bradyrhizobium sp. Ash2021]|uniref:LmrA/YxaF family transcription factor n=1 Tax=Bradyrhizobium sp. Ash2021 TaxID=2954771 RepID=UPI002815743A|nr:hypothetical protein [Bradyrhizobium sp. Ash2021]WMT74981.1 hypothetical protein NL528_00595 [Bradyrhizobium sp. Ash2021]
MTLAGEAVREGIARAAEASEGAEIFLVRIVRGMTADLERSDYREGYPIATTALETSAQSEVLAAATRTAFQKWESEIKRGLERFGMTAEEADLLRPSCSARSKARCCRRGPTAAPRRYTAPSRR